MEIRKLPITFGKNGHSYTQLRRTQYIALYTGVNNYGSITYEVHKVRIQAAATGQFKALNGEIIKVDYPNRESLANNEEFGGYAWSYHTEADAIAKFEALTK